MMAASLILWNMAMAIHFLAYRCSTTAAALNLRVRSSSSASRAPWRKNTRVLPIWYSLSLPGIRWFSSSSRTAAAVLVSSAGFSSAEAVSTASSEGLPSTVVTAATPRNRSRNMVCSTRLGYAMRLMRTASTTPAHCSCSVTRSLLKINGLFLLFGLMQRM